MPDQVSRNSQSKNSFLKSFRLRLVLGLALLLVIVAAGAAFLIISRATPKSPSTTDKSARFVSAAPVDFEQVQSISKFRSCAGHDYSGKDIDGVVETERSMKHYIQPISSLSKTNGQMKIFAPFDGIVINNEPGKAGDNLDLSPTEPSGFIYELGHINSVKSLTNGSKVKAGDLIGYYDISVGVEAVDLQFWYGGPGTVDTLNGYFDSLFAHMTPELARSLEKYGLSEEKLIVSKSERDAHPCHGSTKQLGSTVFEGNQDEDYVVIKNSTAESASPVSGEECRADIPVYKRPPGCSNK